MPQDTYVSPTIRASGTTFAQLKAGGLPAMIDKLIAANPAIAAGAACTATATGGGSTGGLLEAGSYTLRYTYVNGFGESLPSPASSSLTVSAANIPRATFAALPTGAGSRNLYIKTGTVEYLYATGITGTTFDLAVALASSSDTNRLPPAVDSTSAATAQSYLGLASAKELQRAWTAAEATIDAFVGGRPVPLGDAKCKHAKLAATFKALATLLDEVGVLIAANPGAFTTATNPAGEKVRVRTWS